MAIPEDVQEAMRHIFVESDIVTNIEYRAKENCGWNDFHSGEGHPDNVAVQAVLAWIKRDGSAIGL